MRCSLKDGFVILLIFSLTSAEGKGRPLFLDKNSISDRSINFNDLHSMSRVEQSLDSFPKLGDYDKNSHKIVKKQMTTSGYKHAQKKRSVFSLLENPNRGHDFKCECRKKTEQVMADSASNDDRQKKLSTLKMQRESGNENKFSKTKPAKSDSLFRRGVFSKKRKHKKFYTHESQQSQEKETLNALKTDSEISKQAEAKNVEEQNQNGEEKTVEKVPENTSESGNKDAKEKVAEEITEKGKESAAKEIREKGRESAAKEVSEKGEESAAKEISEKGKENCVTDEITEKEKEKSADEISEKEKEKSADEITEKEKEKYADEITEKEKEKSADEITEKEKEKSAADTSEKVEEIEIQNMVENTEATQQKNALENIKDARVKNGLVNAKASQQKNALENIKDARVKTGLIKAKSSQQKNVLENTKDARVKTGQINAKASQQKNALESTKDAKIKSQSAKTKAAETKNALENIKDVKAKSEPENTEGEENQNASHNAKASENKNALKNTKAKAEERQNDLQASLKKLNSELDLNAIDEQYKFLKSMVGCKMNTYLRFPDLQDSHNYFESETDKNGCMTLVYKTCPDGEVFSSRFLECVKPFFWKLVEREKRSLWKKEKNQHCTNTEDIQSPSTWTDVTREEGRQFPSELRSRYKPKLVVYHLKVKKSINEDCKNKKKKQHRTLRAPFLSRSELGRKMPQRASNVKNRHHQLFPRSFIIRINKKGGKRDHEEKVSEEDSDESKYNGDDDDIDEEEEEEEEEEDDDDDDDEEVKEETNEEDEDVDYDDEEKKPVEKNGIKEFFKSAKEAITNRAKFNEPADTSFTLDKTNAYNKNKKLDGSVKDSKKVLIDADIKVDKALGKTLKKILGKRRDKDDSNISLNGNLLGNQGKQNLMESEQIKMYENLIRSNLRLKRYILLSLDETKK